ncbi:hypothetical protein Vadar_014524 [Vaccinium darrowii]|uniref:Uncharacterized protein n=1 Tax=Vaccinium darrowii TaxID=229202 RepID=A0ACB7ZJJ5_9ERIC|nr:hypothetical protein Vadar_014524 [Vaccinium darrowii]
MRWKGETAEALAVDGRLDGWIWRKGGRNGEREGGSDGVEVEGGAEDGVGNLELVDGNLEEEVWWFQEEEGYGCVGADWDGLAPTMLGGADGVGLGLRWVWVVGLRHLEGLGVLDCFLDAAMSEFNEMDFGNDLKEDD